MRSGRFRAAGRQIDEIGVGIEYRTIPVSSLCSLSNLVEMADVNESISRQSVTKDRASDGDVWARNPHHDCWETRDSVN